MADIGSFTLDQIKTLNAGLKSGQVYYPPGTTCTVSDAGGLLNGLTATLGIGGAFGVGGGGSKNPRRPASCHNHAPHFYGNLNFASYSGRGAFVVPMNADYNDLEITWPGYAMQGAEIPLIEGFSLACSLEVDGFRYPMQAPDGSLVHNFDPGSASVAKFTCPGFKGYLRRGSKNFYRYAISGTRNQRWLVTGNVDGGGEQWVFNSTQPGLDYTAGGEPGGAQGFPNLVLQGDQTYSISAINVTNGGSNYGSSVTIRAVDPDTGRSAIVQTRTATNGICATGSSGSGMTNNTLWGPKTIVSFSGPPTNVATAQELYRPMLISGIPSNPVNAWKFEAASTENGYGGGDTNGNSDGAYSPIGRATGRSVAICHQSYPSQNLQTWANSANFPLTNGVWDPVCNFYACDFTNDIGNNANTFYSIRNIVDQCFARMRAKGYSCTVMTPTPRTSGPWTSAATQAPANADFGPLGMFASLTWAIRHPSAGNGFKLDCPPIDWAKGIADPDNMFVWRSDQVLLGPFLTAAALQTARAAIDEAGSVGIVGAQAPYNLYDSTANVWTVRAQASLGPYATVAAAETAFPSASNVGRSALIGTGPLDWVLYNATASGYIKHGLAHTGDGSHGNLFLQRNCKKYLLPFIPDINSAQYTYDLRGLTYA